MEMLEKIPPEILIYLQNVRKYFSINDHARVYFKIDSHGEEFFDGLTEMSQKNLKNTGDAQLTIAQFEELRSKVLKEFQTKGAFRVLWLNSLGVFGLISLN